MKLNDFPKTVRIKEVIVESSLVNTYILDHSVGAEPGQFINLWIPRMDEKPFSVAFDDPAKNELWLTIAGVGPVSNKLKEFKPGDTVGIRGPYGSTFQYEKGERIALLAGGYGAAPLYFLAQRAVAAECTIEFIIGARSEDLLLYVDRVKKMGNVNLHLATDDGSAGHHGYNTQVLDKLVSEGGIDRILTVGPEIMMKKAVDLSLEKGIACQASVERYMKCGFGVCGACCVDGTGEPSCTKGPPMDAEYISKLPGWGNYHRDNVGKKIQ